MIMTTIRGELVNLAGVSEHATVVAELHQTLQEAVAKTFPADGITPLVKEGGLWAPNLTNP